MSKRANPTLIGAFVVGAIAIFVVAILLFSSGKWFSKPEPFVLFFVGSVKGLNIGAPVSFRGVNIGTVTDIKLKYDPQTKTVYIPVYVNIDPDSFTTVGTAAQLTEDKLTTEELIRDGLRAQLQLQSLLTGQLFIQLDYFKNRPAILIGAESDIEELPTIQTSFQEMGKAFQDLDLKQLSNDISSTLNGITRLVNAPEILSAIRSFDQALQGMVALVDTLNTNVGPLTSDANKAINEAHQTLADIRRLTQHIDTQVTPIANQAELTLSQAQTTLKATNNLVSEDSEFVYDATQAIRELADAARSVRVLADTIERNPEVFFRGKSTGGGTK